MMRGMWPGLGLLFAPVIDAAEEFSFDATQFEKKPYEFNAYVEMYYERFQLAQDNTGYILNFLGQPDRHTINRGTGVLEINGKFKKNQFSAEATLHSYYLRDDVNNDSSSDDKTRLYEAFGRYQPGSQWAVEAGKRASRWGKGYAWNPVGFVERPKDPNDPELSREGYVIAGADYIKSYIGDLHTIAITPVLLPVTNDINSDYGKTDEINLAGKVYFLYKNTDIDLVALNHASRSARYGLDFSRNVSPNFEIHGEWAYISEVRNPLINVAGLSSVEVKDAHQGLLGLRYLTESDTTYILEYYYNGAGYSDTQLEDYYRNVKAAAAYNNVALLNKYKTIGINGYLRRNPGEQYVYLRASNKEPFDILYFTPAFTLIYNVMDRSYSLTPEAVYTGITNLELRLKVFILQGREYSEFGEKQNRSKVEIRARYYF